MELPPEVTRAELRDWHIEPNADRTMRVRRSVRWRLMVSGKLLAVLLLVVGLQTAMLVLHLYSGDSDRARAFWCLLGFFALVDLPFLLLPAWLVLGREVWLASPDSLELQWELFGFRWSRRHTEATLAITVVPSRPGGEERRLSITSRGQSRTLAPLGTAAELDVLGSLLSTHTGWSLSRPLTLEQALRDQRGPIKIYRDDPRLNNRRSLIMGFAGLVGVG